MADALRSRKHRADCDSGIQPHTQQVQAEIHPAWLWLASFVVTFGLGYCLWHLMPEPGLLADSLLGAQASIEEGPVILSSPNHMEPPERLNGGESSHPPK